MKYRFFNLYIQQESIPSAYLLYLPVHNLLYFDIPPKNQIIVSLVTDLFYITCNYTWRSKYKSDEILFNSFRKTAPARSTCVGKKKNLGQVGGRRYRGGR